ncbi:MAG: hypothetical protein K2X87_01410 [Gemmataceae bacterium]|nr:hypothetical protein [Gemmataceae bacterium]
MNYEVLYIPPADDHLLAALTAGPEVTVLRAAHRADAVLGYFPGEVGESRADDERVFIEPPLSFFYRVDEAGRRVFVHRVVLAVQ